jgi:hypothetical protein
MTPKHTTTHSDNKITHDQKERKQLNHQPTAAARGGAVTYSHHPLYTFVKDKGQARPTA